MNETSVKALLEGFKMSANERAAPRVATAKEVLNFLEHENIPSFDLGDIVVWRPGMADSSIPKEGQEGIVTQVFDSRRHDFAGKSVGSALITNDIAIGFITEGPDGEDVFAEFAFDSRRFDYALDANGNRKHVSNEDQESEG